MTRPKKPSSDRGTLLHVCISERRGVQKHAVPEVRLEEDLGLAGDAHAGAGHRQLSLLDDADIASMRAATPDLELAPGAFGENLIVRGVDLASLGIGTRLLVGGALIEITQIGKECHSRCSIYEAAGDCIMPRQGLFARVLKGAVIAPGTTVEVLDRVDRRTIQAAVLTVSDRCARGETEDTAGPAVASGVTDNLPARIVEARTVADEIDEIAARLRAFAARRLDLVLTVGGTGCAPRDVTPEATRSVIEREVSGLAEAMRMASVKVTSHALLQRGVCGIRGSTLIINLPGSEKAATENLDAIIHVLPHAVDLLRGQATHPDERPGA